MIHPRTPEILVVALSIRVGVLMPVQLGLIVPRSTVEEPLEIQAHIIPAAPEPIKQSEPPRQQPVKRETPKPVNIVRPAAQFGPTPAPMSTPMFSSSDNASVVPTAPLTPPAPTSEQTPASTSVPSGPIGVGINDVQCSEPPFVYPSMSQKMDKEGCAIVKISIGAAGGVTNVAVVSPSDSPHLNYAAVDAVHTIRCNPCKQSGRAVPVVASRPFVSKLGS